MDKTFRAVYHPPSGCSYNAMIFLSSITLSIRFTDANNEIKDVYWLAENISSLEETALASILIHTNNEGYTERLVMHDAQLVQAIKKHYSHQRFIGGWKHQLLGKTRNKIFLFLTIVMALLLSAYFWFIPWMGENVARNISKEWEISMGQKMYQSIMSQYKIDSARTKIINAFFRELHYDLHYPVSITVVDAKEVNAFAVPGGHIVVYRSILDRMQEPEELAALISHEVSHIELRHSLRNIFRSMARKLFLMMVIGNESGLAGFLVDHADDLKGLEYSRTLETEADNYGINLMNAVDIDPGGMLSLMEILQKETLGKEPAGFLSTHPIFKKRIENIKEQIKNPVANGIKNDQLKSIFRMLQRSGVNANW